MRPIIPYFTFAIIGFVLLSCNDADKKADKKATNSNAIANYFIKDSIGIFREAELGDDIEVIMQLEEPGNLVLNDSVRLIYKYYITDNRYYTVAYTFQDKNLSEICFDLVLDNETEAENITEAFHQFYDQKFGKHITDMGYLVWNTQNAEGKSNIDLKDESSEYGYGKVNLTVYRN